MLDTIEADPRLAIGANNPPDDTPFEAIKVHIDDLYAEAKGWLDGEPITTQGQADAVSNLLNMIREAEKAADAERVKENEPFDTGKAEVQARYAPLIANTKAVKGKTVLASEACKAALQPWLTKLDAEKRAAAEAARLEAERLANEAAEAARAAGGNLEAREQAEELISEAQRAEKAATAAAKDTAKASGGFGRAASLRSSYRADMTDPVAAARHYWEVRREECETFFLGLARADVLAGKREIPGFDVIEERTVV